MKRVLGARAEAPRPVQIPRRVRGARSSQIPIVGVGSAAVLGVPKAAGAAASLFDIVKYTRGREPTAQLLASFAHLFFA